MQIDPVQVAFVKWGNKYPPCYINNLSRRILAGTRRQVRFVCITDDDEGLDSRIVVRPFPDLGMPLSALVARGGCLPKLAVFSPSLLDPDIATVFLDIDTAVLGDIGALVDLLDRHPCLHALPNHVIPHWRAPILSRLAPERCFFVNSSVMVFVPGRHSDIFESFLHLFSAEIAKGRSRAGSPWHLQADERFVSWHERGRLRAIPSALAGSFKDLYMMPWVRLARMQDALRFVRRRREGRVALTFHGSSLKPEVLLATPPGAVICHRGLTTIWSYPELASYWQDVLSQ